LCKYLNILNHAFWVKYLGGKNMKHNKKMLIGVLLLAMFLVNMASPASAYSYAGYKWSQGSAGYTRDSTIPSSWSNSIFASAANAWNGAGANFYFYSIGGTNNKLYYAGLSSDYLAGTWTHRITNDPTHISYSETYFNKRKSWSTSGEPGYYDVQNVATHEFGHWLDLNDLSDSSDTEKTMYYSISYGELKKRSLESDDIAGIRSIYP
jgi:hypothetical protein